ncbi:MAG: PepSY domain-containing protein, partial [Paracoccaceae bacterium]
KDDHMTRKAKLLAVSIAALGLTPLMASAEQTNPSESALFQNATISLQTAGETALSTHAGTLASVQFNDENGTGVYEALVVDADGMSWMVKVDAMTGRVLAQGQAALMDDEDEGDESAEVDDGESGESNDG